MISTRKINKAFNSNPMMSTAKFKMLDRKKPVVKLSTSSKHSWIRNGEMYLFKCTHCTKVVLDEQVYVHLNNKRITSHLGMMRDWKITDYQQSELDKILNEIK